MRTIWSAVPLAALLLCAGCWDKKEINELAIVTAVGVDKDPATGMNVVYYQVINPTALSRQGAGSKAAVYTYRFKDYSLGRFVPKTSTIMPRLLFTSHLQCYILSERIAKKGITDILNYVETNPERRTNAFLFVTDSPMQTVMDSFTTLERVPGRYITSLIRIYSRGSTAIGAEQLRIKDVAASMEFHLPTLVPVLHYHGDQPASDTKRVEQIDSSQNAMSFGDGAVFIKGRMEGRLDIRRKTYFLLLNKRFRLFVETLRVHGADVDVEAHNIQVKRKWNRSRNRLTIRIHSDLRILNNQQSAKMDLQNVHEIEKAFNRNVTRHSESLVDWARQKNWDLLGLQDEGASSRSWRFTDVQFAVTSNLTTIGNMSGPYLKER